MDRKQAFIKASGLSAGKAEKLYGRLLSAGYKNPGAWHANRSDSLLAKRFVEERVKAGVSPNLAKREVDRLNRAGLVPGAWHAKRIESLNRSLFLKQRKKMGVSDARATAELASLQKHGGFRIDSESAKRLPVVPESSPDGFQLSGDVLIIKTVGQWVRLLDVTPDIFWDYEDWITSIMY